MRRAAVVALAVVVGGGLWLSASSTLALGERHGVPAGAQPALVVVLEVAAVIGTALWVTAPAGERRDPAVVVVASSAVAGVGGWAAYGWVGVLGPAATVFVAHMIAKRWSALDGNGRGSAAGDTLSSAGGVDCVDTLAAGPDRSLTPISLVEAPTATVGETPTVAPTGATSPPTTDDELVAALVARPELPGRDAVKREFAVGTRRAERVLEAATAHRDAHRRPHLVTTAEEATS